MNTILCDNPTETLPSSTARSEESDTVSQVCTALNLMNNNNKKTQKENSDQPSYFGPRPGKLCSLSPKAVLLWRDSLPL